MERRQRGIVLGRNAEARFRDVSCALQEGIAQLIRVVPGIGVDQPRLEHQARDASRQGQAHHVPGPSWSFEVASIPDGDQQVLTAWSEQVCQLLVEIDVVRGCAPGGYEDAGRLGVVGGLMHADPRRYLRRLVELQPVRPGRPVGHRPLQKGRFRLRQKDIGRDVPEEGDRDGKPGQHPAWPM